MNLKKVLLAPNSFQFDPIENSDWVDLRGVEDPVHPDEFQRHEFVIVGTDVDEIALTPYVWGEVVPSGETGTGRSTMRVPRAQFGQMLSYVQAEWVKLLEGRVLHHIGFIRTH